MSRRLGALPTTVSRDELPTYRPDSGAALALSFVPIGPTRMRDPFPTSGKVNAYAVNPKNPKTIYVASGFGTGLKCTRAQASTAPTTGARLGARSTVG